MADKVCAWVPLIIANISQCIIQMASILVWAIFSHWLSLASRLRNDSTDVTLLVKIPGEDFTDVTLAMQMMLEVVMGAMDTDVDKVAAEQHWHGRMDENE